MSPYFVLAVLIGLIYGAIFHLWRGKRVKDIVYYSGAGVVGFGLGQTLGVMLGRQVFSVGPLHIIEASLASWLVLFLARWLKGS